MNPAPSPALERFKAVLATRQLADKTRRKYLEWAARYIAFRRGGPKLTPEDGIAEFLSSLTPCSVANQRGALAALAGKNGLYQANGKTVGKLPHWVNAKRPERVPVWVTMSEAEAIIAQLPDPWNLVAGLMFGSGLRIGETIDLRWRCLDFERGTVSIRSGKGDKCRITPLSARLVEPMLARRTRVRGLYQDDRAAKRTGVAPVPQLVRKYPSHGTEWPFFWVFPSAKESTDPATGIRRRHHLHDKSFAKALRPAVRRAGIDKRVTAHSFRHGFATAYLLAGGNLRELQARLGHTNISTTMRYLHCIPQEFDRIGSPWDIPAQAPSTIVPFPGAASYVTPAALG
jgi:integrase